MRLILFLLVLIAVPSWGQTHNPTFIIKLTDAGLRISAPEKKMKMFSVIVENNSLSDQVAKFVTNNQNLKFMTVEAGKSQTVEIENKGGASVFFVPISPSFQEVELIFGKKTYEVPPKR